MWSGFLFVFMRVARTAAGIEFSSNTGVDSVSFIFVFLTGLAVPSNNCRGGDGEEGGGCNSGLLFAGRVSSCSRGSSGEAPGQDRGRAVLRERLLLSAQ